MGGRQPKSSTHRIHQSVVRWSFQKIPLDTFCKAAAEIGLECIDVLMPEEYEAPARYGPIVNTGFTGYVAHEFVPTKEPLVSLAEAFAICNV